MSVTIKQLEIFNAVVVAGGIGKAARTIGLSTPTISQQLAKMESALGTQLINRSGGPELDLTPAGEFWFRHSTDIVDRVVRAETFHETHFRGGHTVINFGITPSLSGHFLAAAARIAVEDSRFLRFEVAWGPNSFDVIERIALHQINCGVVSADSAPAHSSSLYVVPIFRDQIVWAVPRDIPRGGDRERAQEPAFALEPTARGAGAVRRRGDVGAVARYVDELVSQRRTLRDAFEGREPEANRKLMGIRFRQDA